MKNLNTARFPLLAAVMLGALSLSACTTVGYRCPLDHEGKAESPTACASMQEAMAGAKKGTGGKASVLMDDKGRLVPRELLENKVAQPLAANAEPYRNKSGEPVFHQPKVFQVWTGAFVDAEGNLHDGHTSWFSTPGRWAYGTVDRPGEVGSNSMRPALPDTRPAGRVVKVDPNTGREMQVRAAADQRPAATQPNSQQERDKAALQTLSSAANSAAAKSQAQHAQPAKAPTAAGVTAPAVGLSD